MEYRDDLKKLSWDELYRLLIAEIDLTRQLRCLADELEQIKSQQGNMLRSLRSELRAAQDSLAKLEAKKESEPLPTFEVGKCYRNRVGEIIGPLEENHDHWHKTHPVRFRNFSYRQDGMITAYSHEQDGDLLPGPVDPPPTWTPWPWLPAGEYVVGISDGKWRCRKPIEGWVGMSFQHARQLVGYTSDPPTGRWQVKDGTATYLGES